MAKASEVISYSQRNRRKPFKWFLEYLKHAQDCQRGDLKDPIIDSYTVKLCKLQLCNYVDQVLAHQMLLSCKGSKSCSINACYSSLKTLLHCKECTESDCLVCVPVKGMKQLKPQMKETNSGDLDTTCGVYFDERKIGTGTCVETRTVETQTDEFIPEDSSKVDPNENKVDQEQNETINTAYLPGGLILENVNLNLDEIHEGVEVEDKPIFFLMFRIYTIIKFIRTVIGKTDIFTMIERKLFNFYKYITSIEQDISDSTSSKDEYSKKLSEKIIETSEEFENCKFRQKFATVEDAADLYFKSKIAEMLGNEEVKEIIFSSRCLVLKLGKPLHKTTKRWHKTISPSDREKAIWKGYLKWMKKYHKSTFPDHEMMVLFSCDSVEFIDMVCEMEEFLFRRADSKSVYYYYIQKYLTCSTEPEEEYLTAKKESKKYLKNYKNILKQFPENKINEISNYKTEENESDLKVNSSPSVFCYSHFLLLIYSVSYQLWKKSEEEREVEENQSKA